MPRASRALRKGSASRAFGLENATAEQLRAIPPESFWPLTAPLNIAPGPCCPGCVLPEPMLDVSSPPSAACPHHDFTSDEASVMAVFGIDLAGQIQAPPGSALVWEADQAALSRRERR